MYRICYAKLMFLPYSATIQLSQKEQEGINPTLCVSGKGHLIFFFLSACPSSAFVNKQAPSSTG